MGMYYPLDQRMELYRLVLMVAELRERTIILIMIIIRSRRSLFNSRSTQKMVALEQGKTMLSSWIMLPLQLQEDTARILKPAAIHGSLQPLVPIQAGSTVRL